MSRLLTSAFANLQKTIQVKNKFMKIYFCIIITLDDHYNITITKLKNS